MRAATVLLLQTLGVILLLPALALSSASYYGVVEFYGLRVEGTWPWFMGAGLVMLALAALVSVRGVRR